VTPHPAPNPGARELAALERQIEELNARYGELKAQLAALRAADAPAVVVDLLSPPLAQIQSGLVQFYQRKLVLQKGRDPYVGSPMPAGTVDITRIVTDAGAGGGSGGAATIDRTVTYNNTLKTGWADA
jgi:N-acetylmuramoyl-L-alanine amidase